MKRIVGMALLIAFLMSIFPANVLAADDANQMFTKPMFEPESVNHYEMYVVTDQYVPVRAEPSSSSEIIKRVNAGVFLYVEPIKNDSGNLWYRIKEKDADGYIYSSHLRIHNHEYQVVYSSNDATLASCECGEFRISERKNYQDYNVWDLMIEALAGNWAPTQTAMGMMAHYGLVKYVEKIPVGGQALEMLFMVSDTAATAYLCIKESCGVVGLALTTADVFISYVVEFTKFDAAKPFWKSVGYVDQGAQIANQLVDDLNFVPGAYTTIPVKDLDRDLQNLVIESIMREKK